MIHLEKVSALKKQPIDYNLHSSLLQGSYKICQDSFKHSGFDSLRSKQNFHFHIPFLFLCSICNSTPLSLFLPPHFHSPSAIPHTHSYFLIFIPPSQFPNPHSRIAPSPLSFPHIHSPFPNPHSRIAPSSFPFPHIHIPFPFPHSTIPIPHSSSSFPHTHFPILIPHPLSPSSFPHTHSPILIPPTHFSISISPSPFPHTHSPIPIPPYPFPHTHSPIPIPPYPFPHTHSPIPIPPYPFSHTHSPIPIPPYPFPHTHSPIPIPPYPFPHTHHHFSIPIPLSTCRLILAAQRKQDIKIVTFVALRKVKIWEHTNHVTIDS